MCGDSDGNHAADAAAVLSGGFGRLIDPNTPTNGLSMKKWLIGTGVVASVGFGIWSLYVASRYQALCELSYFSASAAEIKLCDERLAELRGG